MLGSLAELGKVIIITMILNLGADASWELGNWLKLY